MTSSSFRNSMNSLGWTRRTPDAPSQSTTSTTSFFSRLQTLNPFGRGEGYVRLPHEPSAASSRWEQEDDQDHCFALSRWDRMLIFAGCNIGAAVCFLLCFFFFPFLTLKPRKFAILWSVGSVLFLASWAVLMGPLTYIRHLFSGARLPFTAAYFGSIALTLYFAVGLQSTYLTLLSSIFQLAALLWYLVSYFPMGSTGLQLVGRVGAQRVSAWMSS